MENNLSDDIFTEMLCQHINFHSVLTVIYSSKSVDNSE